MTFLTGCRADLWRKLHLSMCRVCLLCVWYSGCKSLHIQNLQEWVTLALAPHLPALQQMCVPCCSPTVAQSHLTSYWLVIILYDWKWRLRIWYWILHVWRFVIYVCHNMSCKCDQWMYHISCQNQICISQNILKKK